jgi:hypothetical protein
MGLAAIGCGLQVQDMVNIKRIGKANFPILFFSESCGILSSTLKSCHSAIQAPVPQYDGNAEYGEGGDGMDKEYIL